MDFNPMDYEPKWNNEMGENAAYMELWKQVDDKIKELDLKRAELSYRETALAEIKDSDLDEEIPVLLGGVYSNMNGLRAQEYLFFEIQRVQQVISDIEDKIRELKSELWARLV